MEAKTRYELQPLTGDEADRWDEVIAPFHHRELFHRQAWLDYLVATRGVEIQRFRILEAGSLRGYFVGGLVRKGPFRILGSPLKGWGTNFMGPVVNEGFDGAALLDSLEALARREGLAVLEVEQPKLFSDELLADRGYEAEESFTLIVRLAPEPSDEMWKAIAATKRNRIRKATKAGLVAEDTDDPAIADEFYDRYEDLMRHKGLVPPYPREYPRQLFRHLRASGNLFALRIRDDQGRVLATGLLPHDDRTVYFWGGSSFREGRDLSPNDLLHWSAMSLAARQGIGLYNMCGHGRFKAQFGGELVPLRRWHKCFWRSARWARRSYRVYFEQLQRLRGWWRRGPEAEADA